MAHFWFFAKWVIGKECSPTFHVSLPHFYVGRCFIGTILRLQPLLALLCATSDTAPVVVLIYLLYYGSKAATNKLDYSI